MTRKGKILNAILCLALIVSLSLAIVGCSSNGTSPTSTPTGTQQLPEKIIKIGVVTSLTGGSAPWGFAERGILEMYATEIRNNGGLIIDGQRVNFQIISVDDAEGTPSVAVAAANKLVYQDQVDIIVTLWGGDSTAIANIVNQNKILEMSSGWSRITNPENPYVFRFILDENAAAIATVAAMHKLDPAAKTVVIVNPDIQDGHTGALADKAAWETIVGGEVLDLVFYDTSTIDYMPISSKIMSFHPDAIDFSGSSPGSIVQIAAQCRELGFTGYFPTGVATFDGAPVGMVTIGMVPGDPSETPIQSHYTKLFKEMYGEYFPFWEYYGNGLYPLFYNFFQDAGSTDMAKVYQTISAPGYTFDTWWGETHWFGKDVPIWGIDRDIASPVPCLVYTDKGQVQLPEVPFSDIEPIYQNIK